METTKTEGRYKCEFSTTLADKWKGNDLRFHSRSEAEAYAFDLAMRWTAVRDWRVVDTKPDETR